jgi:hypothetical protein
MSLLSISNKALRKLGVTEIISLTQQGKPAARCNAAVEGIVKEMLREHSFGFATVWAILPEDATPPPFGYAHAYQLPLECIRPVDIRESTDLKAPRLDFELARGNIMYTDADPCLARYTVYVEGDLINAPPDFDDACAFKLAFEVAVPLTKTDALKGMWDGYRYMHDRAILNDAATNHEREQDINRINDILHARNYPGYSGDNQEET